jgi:hypothetical protein
MLGWSFIGRAFGSEFRRFVSGIRKQVFRFIAVHAQRHEQSKRVVLFQRHANVGVHHGINQRTVLWRDGFNPLIMRRPAELCIAFHVGAFTEGLRVALFLQ